MLPKIANVLSKRSRFSVGNLVQYSGADHAIQFDEEIMLDHGVCHRCFTGGGEPKVSLRVSISGRYILELDDFEDTVVRNGHNKVYVCGLRYRKVSNLRIWITPKPYA